MCVFATFGLDQFHFLPMTFRKVHTYAVCRWIKHRIFAMMHSIRVLFSNRYLLEVSPILTNGYASLLEHCSNRFYYCLLPLELVKVLSWRYPSVVTTCGTGYFLTLALSTSVIWWTLRNTLVTRYLLKWRAPWFILLNSNSLWQRRVFLLHRIRRQPSCSG